MSTFKKLYHFYFKCDIFIFGLALFFIDKKQILETPSFIVLKLGDNSSILVLKQGFIKGDKNSFLEFINNKIKV